MKIIHILAGLLALVPLNASLEAGFVDTMLVMFQQPVEAGPEKIKVLIVHDKAGAVVEVKGKYKLFDPHTGEYISSRYVGKRKFVQAVNDGIKWGEEFPGIYQIMIEPDANGSVLVDGIEYHGTIAIYDIEGAISIVNQIPVEEYLSSTLGNQFRKPMVAGTMAAETLAAVAIVARTAAYYSIEHSPSQYWNIPAEQEGYDGFVSINSASPIEKAIQATKRMVLNQAVIGSKEITLFPAQWSGNGITSLITLEQANQMADKGNHAAQILLKGFPNTRVELYH